MRWDAGGVRWVKRGVPRWIPFGFAQGRLSPRWRVRAVFGMTHSLIWEISLLLQESVESVAVIAGQF